MFEIFIDEEEVICESNFEIKEEFMNPSSIELYKVYPASWKNTNQLLTEYYYPEDYSKCKILKDGNLYFSGFIKNSADMSLNPFKPHFCSLQVLDPSTLLSEGDTLDYVITNKTVSEAIIQVIDSISSYGFVLGNILIPDEDNTVIGAYSTLDKAPYDVFNYLSMISGTRWGTRMIDENITAIDFFSPEMLENSGNIEVTKDYCTSNEIQDITYDYSTSDYRNKQVTTSDAVFSSITQKQTIITNGFTQTFSTEQKIGKIVKISKNGLEMAFATKEDKEQGVKADFYYSVGDTTFDSDILFQAGVKIDIEYVAIVKGREISFNKSEISRISNKISRNGTIARYENRNDSIDSKELQKIGNSSIKYKGLPEISLNIIAHKDFLVLGGKYSFKCPISKLSGEYLVKTKITKVIQNPSMLIAVYEYSLTNSFDTENEINYFDNQRSKSNGNMESGKYISRNIDIENTINIIFKDLSITEIEIAENNILDSSLNGIFIE